MDKIKAIADKLGILDIGSFDGNTFIAKVETSDEFSNIFSAITDSYEMADDGGEFDDSRSMTVFTDDSHEIIAVADYDNDDYTISIGEK